LRDLPFRCLRCITTPIANVDDDPFVSAHPVIDKIRIAGGRKYANAGNVGLSPEAGIAGGSSNKSAV